LRLNVYVRAPKQNYRDDASALHDRIYASHMALHRFLVFQRVGEDDIGHIEQACDYATRSESSRAKFVPGSILSARIPKSFQHNRADRKPRSKACLIGQKSALPAGG
jgi:hypothetical protein